MDEVDAGDTGTPAPSAPPPPLTAGETLRDARDLFAGSDVAREAFGQEVVDHYLNCARIELQAFDAAVTDWERERGFERL